MNEEELQIYRDQLREGLVKYTRKAFRMLPEITNPRILDIGCGSGVPTMELAKLSNGEIIAIDTSQPELDKLAAKIKKAGLCSRVRTVKCSMSNMDFPAASLDIIWAEGSINVIGFNSGLMEWRRLLKTGGFLVVHDDLGDLTEKQKQISQCGYELINHFVLSQDTWWAKYYAPLEKKFNEVRANHAGRESIEILNNEQREIDAFKHDPEHYRSVFLIMRKS